MTRKQFIVGESLKGNGISSNCFQSCSIYYLKVDLSEVAIVTVTLVIVVAESFSGMAFD